MMPEMDGFTMLGEIRQKPWVRSLPVIMLTARAAEEDKLEALTIGVDDYLTKPFSVQELEARVANLLKNAAARQLWSQENKEEEPVFESSESDQEANANLEGNTVLQTDLEWVKLVEGIVKENMTQVGFSIDELAQKSLVSKRQLQRRIKKVTGFTPTQLLKEIRLDAARNYLEKGTYKTISEVAFAVGFQSLNTFSKGFKTRFGKTPSSYL